MIIIKYRGTYRVYLVKDKNGEDSLNLDDTYLKCRNGVTIHRYNADTLKIYFPTTGIARNRVADIIATGVQLKLFQDGDQESTYLFAEDDITKVADVVIPNTKGAGKSPRTKKKRELTEEEKEVLRQRMAKIRCNKGKI